MFINNILVLNACVLSLDDDPTASSAAHDGSQSYSRARARSTQRHVDFPPSTTLHAKRSTQLPAFPFVLFTSHFPARAAMSRPNISYPSPIPGPSASSSSYPQQPLEPSPYLRQPAPRQASGPSRAQVSATTRRINDRSIMDRVRRHAPSILLSDMQRAELR